MRKQDLTRLKFFSNRHRSPAQLAFADAVKNLLKEEDGESTFVEEVACIMKELSKNWYMQYYGLKQSKAAPHHGILKGKKPPCYDDMNPPGRDHSSVFNKDGKPYSFVTQPYRLSYETLKKAIAFCEKHGYELKIFPASWYFYGRTIMMEYKNARKPAE